MQRADMLVPAQATHIAHCVLEITTGQWPVAAVGTLSPIHEY